MPLIVRLHKGNKIVFFYSIPTHATQLSSSFNIYKSYNITSYKVVLW